jgi:hypothetical protein
MTEHSIGDCSPNVMGSTGKIVISCYQQPNDPLNEISFNYMRLFGAVETSVVASMWKNGGIVRDVFEGKPIGWRISNGAAVSDELAKFLSQWEYSKAKPIYNGLWNKLTNYEYVVSNYFSKTLSLKSTKELQICLSQLFVEDDPDRDKRICNKTQSRDVAYLFLLIENLSDRPLTNVSFNFINITNKNAVSDLPINSSNIFTYSAADIERVLPIVRKCKANSSDGVCQELDEKTIPVMRPHDQFVLPIFVYKKLANNDFAGTLLDDAVIPFGVSLSSGAKRASGIVRAPLRNEAARVMLPIGWYYQ